MDARTILTRLRDGQPLSEAQLAWFATGLASGTVTDAQAGAFAMAALLNGLTTPERVGLTRAMRDSGKTLSWNLPGPVLDKHSTGGIGDCVSLVLAPALAACGAYVPMIAGRGLGHTGGTLDKLESIPGYRAEVPVSALKSITGQIGCAIVGASADIAPADKRLYAVRDVTGTVESIDLIVASILSKKLAAGLEGLVLDVKVGSGAFMKDMQAAEALARALVETAQGAGCMTTALITDMSQPLVAAAGNALEVIEVMETLTGIGVTPALWDITCALGGEVLALGGLAADAADGAGRIARVLDNGEAALKFGEMVAEMGGPADFIERWPDRLPAAPVVHELRAPRAGWVQAIDAHAIGLAVVGLGGGRRRERDRINPSVGLSEIAALGDEVGQGEVLALIHATSETDAEATAAALADAFTIAEAAADIPPLVHQRILS
ncbi:thymidine phosphorylase [Rhodovulum adriaticum]|uniref:Thymidine phosphorylase n=1 Tax=Rhodovulum adriaticum TaxID=35804 RepID=A0A4R2NHS6_RHOAD|nr:thymidine phosphorylase [Rhodovulum adriaticum]MBK1635825.1 thymidine phosphorylase [Rhodovulum adriaticum]TCP21009.1 thymidine phosphorylase [Rhodovulum adriaticum]